MNIRIPIWYCTRICSRKKHAAAKGSPTRQKLIPLATGSSPNNCFDIPVV